MLKYFVNFTISGDVCIKAENEEEARKKFWKFFKDREDYFLWNVGCCDDADIYITERKELFENE